MDGGCERWDSHWVFCGNEGTIWNSRFLGTQQETSIQLILTLHKSMCLLKVFWQIHLSWCYQVSQPSTIMTALWHVSDYLEHWYIDINKTRYVIAITNRRIPLKHTWSLGWEKISTINIFLDSHEMYPKYFWNLKNIWPCIFWTFELFVCEY